MGYMGCAQRALLSRKLVGQTGPGSEDPAHQLLEFAQLGHRTKQGLMATTGHAWNYGHVVKATL